MYICLLRQTRSDTSHRDSRLTARSAVQPQSQSPENATPAPHRYIKRQNFSRAPAKLLFFLSHHQYGLFLHRHVLNILTTEAPLRWLAEGYPKTYFLMGLLPFPASLSNGFATSSLISLAGTPFLGPWQWGGRDMPSQVVCLCLFCSIMRLPYMF